MQAVKWHYVLVNIWGGVQICGSDYVFDNYCSNLLNLRCISWKRKYCRHMKIGFNSKRLTKVEYVLLTLFICYFIIPEFIIRVIGSETIGIIYMFSAPLILIFGILSTRFYRFYAENDSRYFRVLLIVGNAVMVLLISMGSMALIFFMI